MTKRLNIIVTIFTAILLSILLPVMIVYCVGRQGEYEAQASDMPDKKNEAQASDVPDKKSETQALTDVSDIYDLSTIGGQYLCIPLSSKVLEKEVAVNNDYINRVLKISISGLSNNFFYNNKLSGNKDNIEKIGYDFDEGITTLSFYYKDICEWTQTYENGNLYLKSVAPRELYSKIIVIDAGHGGDEEGRASNDLLEDEICLDVVMRLKKLLDETDIKVYYTRLSDENVTMEERVALANEMRADLFLSVHTAFEKTDTSIYGIATYYNELFFIPSFNSADFAYLVEEKVTEATRTKGLGLIPGDEDIFIIRNAEVPVALIEVGYLSNRQEAILLSKDDYRDKIARGLYEAIVQSYEEMER